jgi:branched-subunit amino acid transport protein
MKAWIAFLIGGAVTYLMRGSFLLFGDRMTLPDWTRAPLRYVAPAAFAAIALPATLGDGGFANAAPPTAELFGVAAAALVVWKTKNIPACLAVGVAIFYLTDWIGF